MQPNPHCLELIFELLLRDTRDDNYLAVAPVLPRSPKPPPLPLTPDWKVEKGIDPKRRGFYRQFLLLRVIRRMITGSYY